ncbi:MBL fold metallo-hydrolase [Methanolobus sp. ZRKC2]|uniref:MBL fold metallo-hydrolase n=1 Tax=Methanolobus sp. ZRKC2 TaxID=3125783 RepID=UPI0032534466
MITEIETISLGGFSCNCYLLRTDKGFVLIDTGRKSERKKLEQELAEAGCHPGNLNLIILTHGDFDHTGNCSYIREKYDSKIAMHKYDSGMVEYGDMFWNRKTGNWIIKKMVNVFFRISKFKPDITIDEKTDLSEYGLDAKVLYLPGHSKGSIGILTSDHDLFCGDLFTNTKKPESSSMVDDPKALSESIDKVKKSNVKMVYPGHGKPFLMDSYR